MYPLLPPLPGGYISVMLDDREPISLQIRTLQNWTKDKKLILITVVLIISDDCGVKPRNKDVYSVVKRNRAMDYEILPYTVCYTK